jgi:hypothetical protein
MRRVIVAAMFLFAALPAHSSFGAVRPLPESVEVRALAGREAGNLRLLVRVPLSVIRDIQFPVKRDTDYLDLSAIQTILPAAARYWIQGCFEVYENRERITDIEIAKTRISPFSDDSFRSFESALAHFSEAPPGNNVNLIWNQAWLDIDFHYSLEPGQSVIALEPKVASLAAHVTTQIQYVADRSTREFVFDGNPGLIYLEPRFSDVAIQFIEHGFSNVVRSPDLALFIFCLVLPFRRLRDVRLLALVFAAAITTGLIAPAFGSFARSVWLRPLVETASALLILFVAVANILKAHSPGRIMLAASGGILYGISAFTGLAGKLQFSGTYRQTGSFAYWLGLLLAAEFALGILLPAILILLRPNTKRLELIVVSGLAADTALGWLQESWLQLRKLPWRMPVLDVSFIALLLQILAILLFVGGCYWFLKGWWASPLPLGEVGAQSAPGEGRNYGKHLPSPAAFFEASRYRARAPRRPTLPKGE